MSSSSVWVQLYYKEKDEPEGQPVEIKPIPNNIDALKREVRRELDLDARLNLIFVYPPTSSGDKKPCYKAGKPLGRVFKIKPVPDDVDALAREVKVERPNALSHCDAADLAMYSPGTTSFSEENSMKPGRKLADLIEELKNTTPPTSDDHPLIVVAPPAAPAPAPAPQQIEAQFYKNAKLPRLLLEESGLEDYINAAEAQANSPYTKELLDYLMGLQTNSDKNEDLVFPKNTKTDEPNLYASIVASSGTGKTQLAATAALNCKEKATTVYLQFGDGNQRFYQPHMTQSAIRFKNQLLIFLDMLRAGIKEAAVSVSIIKNWAKDSDKGASIFVHILHQLLLDERSPEKCFLKDLKNKIKGKTFLFFLDEVPQRNKGDFDKVLCLRDTLRYLGIAPILMSTHTGAQDYVGELSRNSASTWMHIISKLPPYTPSPDAKEKVILFKSERPLVLGIALPLSESGNTVPQIVRNIRRHLQKAKGNAWSENPALQLVQLFCTDIDIEKEVFAVAHSLVGHHFGCLQQSGRGATNFGARPYSSHEARIFSSNLTVAPVSARFEPLLYLALVTWDENMLKTNSQEYFPLTNMNLKPITVRQAYDSCSHVFKSKAICVNQQAQKANGDLLEVLVHASLSLASMKTSTEENKYLAGVSLKEYLPLVRLLMLPGKFDCIPHPPVLFDYLNVEWITIPALGGCDSGLPIELADATKSSIGFLSRPEDKAMVDGNIFLMSKENGKLERSDKPCISVECKNYSDGVDAEVLKQVFKRIASNIKFCFVFVSSLKGKIFERTRLDSLKEECFAEHSHDGVSVLRWDLKNKEPTFFSIGKEEFKATTKKTELLVVIIEVGLIDAKEWDRKRKRKEGYQACANLAWEVDHEWWLRQQRQDPHLIPTTS